MEQIAAPSQFSSRADVHNKAWQGIEKGQFAQPEKLPSRVIVFGISSLPEQTLQLLAALGQHRQVLLAVLDRKSTRLNSSHVRISYAVFCLKKKIQKKKNLLPQQRGWCPQIELGLGHVVEEDLGARQGRRLPLRVRLSTMQPTPMRNPPSGN